MYVCVCVLNLLHFLITGVGDLSALEGSVLVINPQFSSTPAKEPEGNFSMIIMFMKKNKTEMKVTKFAFYV